jgi:hypothetical protein
VQNPTKMLAFSECMRANGIPDFPDPTSRKAGDALARSAHLR